MAAIEGLLTRKVMRGREKNHRNELSWTSAEPLVPREHPLRLVRALADAALRELEPEFDGLYAKRGRWSIPPEKLLRVLLLQVLYGIPNDETLTKELNHNFLFRWFVGLDADHPGWAQSSLRKNRERLKTGHVGGKFFRKVVASARPQGLFLANTFSVNRTLLAQWIGR